MLQIVRDWVLKLNAGDLGALGDNKGLGPQPILTNAHRAVLAQAIEDARSPPSTEWFAGVWSTLCNGCPTTSSWLKLPRFRGVIDVSP